MATINDPTFVDGTFEAGNIIYGRTLAPSGTSNTTRQVTVTFGSDGAPAFTAGSGDPVVVVTGYGNEGANRLAATSGISNVTISGVSASGFTIYVRRSGTGTTWVYWIAMRNP